MMDSHDETILPQWARARLAALRADNALLARRVSARPHAADVPAVGTRLDPPASLPCRTCGTRRWSKRIRGWCQSCYERARAQADAAGWLCADCAAPLREVNAEYCARCARQHREAK